ncbi:MAG: Kazal domain-containing protein [Candidatus Electrothrix sp. LOE2]|nr:Kazal domain-containing protein [Candidatus Electrothrix sp. LOE2]
MKFSTLLMMLMSCAVLLLLNGCYYPGPHHQPPAAVRPPQPSPGVCGGIAGWGCPSGQYCNFGVGRCNMPDAQGTCQSRPQACTREYKPVCGCNGTTYGNACAAASAGVSVEYPGTCRNSGRPDRHHRRRR